MKNIGKVAEKHRICGCKAQDLGPKNTEFVAERFVAKFCAASFLCLLAVRYSFRPL